MQIRFLSIIKIRTMNPQQNNSNLKLIGFSDCPNMGKASKLLNELGINHSVETITIDEAKKIPEYYGSPSFIYKDKNIETGEHAWSCRLVDWDILRNHLIAFRAKQYFCSQGLNEVQTVSRKEMIEIDYKSVNNYKLPISLMMENAGSKLAELTMEYTSSKQEKILGVIGKGNNGGGVFSALRYLHNKGYVVKVLLTIDKKEIAKESAIQLEMLNSLEIEIITKIEDFKKIIEESNIILDGIVGYNLNRNIEGELLNLVNSINESHKIVISNDVPTGLDVDTGEVMGTAIRASTTLTLALPKLGFLNTSAKNYLGSLYLADIGIPLSELGYNSPFNVKKSGNIIYLNY